ncbi:Riboflavin synthase alpha chain (ribE) [Pyrococcus sp. NA2]|uniref:riboflavin synthase n=1 Tax=Pyrococcus sp. (strain NA2) TaxID=342949 RepID=UPI000209AFC1|nr:riboflavin synthase [Pyrococcus sp. NA2]AEC51162.1 Riboflavin synthase alpha chain (ribE) [Pyrococcus sp. NA2]
MFSGIIEKVARAYCSGRRLYVENVISVNVGDSVSVNGVCLTVVDIGRYITFELGEETLKKTNLRESRFVNLERALKVGDRINGHLVTGHVDGVIRVRKIVKRGNTYWIAFEIPKNEFGIVEKGSIALNGISLTIAKVENEVFWVQVVPYTWENTNFRFLKVGDKVNYEIDLVAKYIKALGDFYGCKCFKESHS